MLSSRPNFSNVGEWQRTGKLGSGSFGVIFQAPGIPKIHHFEKMTSAPSSAMVMELLGPSLEDLFNFCDRSFSRHTILMIADQLLHRMEYIHSKNILHRDIKPDNFLIHYDSDIPIIYLIDYGLSKLYRLNNEHIPYRENKLLTGTARYASINTHLGIEQSRRDDLESLGYVLLYFLKGELPWQGIQARNKNEKYDLIMECKVNTSLDILTNGREEFIKYINYCRGLQFTDTPDYRYLRGLFHRALVNDNLSYDFKFDWYKKELIYEEVVVEPGKKFPNKNADDNRMHYSGPNTRGRGHYKNKSDLNRSGGRYKQTSQRYSHSKTDKPISYPPQDSPNGNNY
jgi:serine/threonine protein kinase